MSFKNTKLYDALRAHVTTVFHLVAERAGVPPSSRAAPGEEAETSVHVSVADLRALPEYGRCLDLIAGDPVVAVHLNRFVGTSVMGGAHFSAPQLLESIVPPGAYPRDLVFDDGIFKSLYEQFERVLYEDSFRCEAIAPLQGLFIDVPEIKFSDDLEISQLTVEEEKQLHVMEVVRRYGARWTDRLYAVRAKSTLPKVIVRDQSEIPEEEKARDEAKQSEARARVEELIHTLRVFKGGTLHYGGVIQVARSWPFGGAINISGKPLEPVYGIYPLNEPEDVSGLKKLWDEVQSTGVKNHKFLAVAMRRFSYGCERHRIEDKLIDLMIAAEAFTQAQGEKGKGKHIAEKVSSVAPRCDRMKVKTHMRKSYQLRNSIMHDGDVKARLTEYGLTAEDLPSFVSLTEQYLRDALRQTINRCV